MKIEEIKNTEKTLTCLLFMKDKTLELKINKEKYLQLYLFLRRKLKHNRIIFLENFAEIVWSIVNIRKPYIYNGFDLLAFMCAKEPDDNNTLRKYKLKKGDKK